MQHGLQPENAPIKYFDTDYGAVNRPAKLFCAGFSARNDAEKTDRNSFLPGKDLHISLQGGLLPKIHLCKTFWNRL
ncbi:MAG: hypothetical protein LBR10_10090, partial [Prevotellaceae bacterium]|nr:hypothetical protein [Prevotellaceae bacterium]